MPDERDADVIANETPLPWPEDGTCVVPRITYDGYSVTCGNDLLLCEGGYIRAWTFEVLPAVNEDEDGTVVAVFHGLEDFGDDGDGKYWAECSTCLQRYELPDEWDWE